MAHSPMVASLPHHEVQHSPAPMRGISRSPTPLIAGYYTQAAWGWAGEGIRASGRGQATKLPLQPRPRRGYPASTPLHRPGRLPYARDTTVARLRTSTSRAAPILRAVETRECTLPDSTFVTVFSETPETSASSRWDIPFSLRRLRTCALSIARYTVLLLEVVGK